MTTTTLDYSAPWTPLDELTEESTPDSAQFHASPITPHASPRCEVNPPVVVSALYGSLDSLIGGDHLAPVSSPALGEELLPDFTLQAKPAETTWQNDKPSPGGRTSEGAPFSEEDTAVWDALAPSSLSPELPGYHDNFQEIYSPDPPYDVADRPEDLASPGFRWEDPPEDALPGSADDSDLPWDLLLDLDETGQGTLSSSASVAATHSEAQGSWMQRPPSQPQAVNSASSSHSSLQLLPRTPSLPTAATAGPPAVIPRAFLAGFLLGVSMSSLHRGASGVRLHRTSTRRPNRLQEQRLSTPPEEDDDVVFVKSRRKRPLSADDSYPVKRLSRASYPVKRLKPSSRVNVLLTQVIRQFHDGDRVYDFDRVTHSWRDKHDHTVLPDVRFDEGGDYKTLTVKVHPGGLSGMPVFLSWDGEEGMFRGYDIAGADRLVGRHAVEKLMRNPCKSLEINWPDLDYSL